MKQQLGRSVISTIVDSYTSIFQIWFSTFAQIFDSLKIQDISNFYFERRAAEKHKHFIFLKGCYFVIVGPIDMNVGVFWENSVGFLKPIVLQLFLKYSQSYVNLNVKNNPKFNGP